MKHTVLTIGSATRDIFLQELIEHDHEIFFKDTFLFLKEGAKIGINKIQYAIGGGAVNTAISFCRQQMTTALCCTIGDDELGKSIVETISKMGMRIYHTTSSSQSTGISFILPTDSGNRIILAYRGANMMIDTLHIPWNIFVSFDALYLAPLSGGSISVLPALVHAARDNKMMLAMNPSLDQLSSEHSIQFFSLLTHIHVLLLNKEEACTLFVALLKANKVKKYSYLESSEGILMMHFHQVNDQWYSIKDYFDSILACGIRYAVVTNGAEGVYVGTTEGFYFTRSIAGKFIHTVGAGDAFGSTFFASILQGYTVSEAMIRGIHNSCAVMQQYDANHGLLTRDVLDQLLLNTQNHPVFFTKK